MKKLYSKLLFLIFTLQLVTISVSASESNGWQFGIKGSLESLHVSEIRETASYEGLSSLYMDCYEAKINEANYIEVKNSLIATPEVGEYTLKFYVKPGQYGQWTGTFDVSFGNQTYTVDAGAGSRVSAPSGETGWIEKVLNFNYDGTGDGALYIKAYYNLFEVHIDGVSLTLSGSDENLIANGSFEDGGTEEPSDTDEPYDRTDYKPERLMISPGSNILGINWKNPAISPVKISLYDISSGEEVLLTDEFSKTPKKAILYKISGLRNGMIYKYKLVFDFGSKGKDSYYLCSTPSGNDSVEFDNITFKRNMLGTAGYCPGELIVDNTTGYNSSSALKIVSNIDLNQEEMASNIYLMFRMIFNEMTTGGRYEISYKYKTENLQKNYQAHMSWSAFENEGLFVDSVGSTDWVSKKHMYTYDNSNVLTFILDGECDAMWIDDIECYEVNENGERITGINMAHNGDFETEELLFAGAISNVSAEADIDTAVISWSNPKASCRGVSLYQKVFDDFEYRGFISSAAESIKLSGLDKGKEYTYKIVPVNNYGAEGKGKEITFTTEVPDYEITDVAIKKNGNKAEGISGKGTYTFAVKAKNYLIEDEIECELIVALFKKNGEMEAIYSQKKDILMTEKNVSPSNIYVTVNVPDDSGYTAEVYLINNRQDIDLFRNPKKY